MTMLIGGDWVEAASGERIDVENPSRREVIAERAPRRRGGRRSRGSRRSGGVRRLARSPRPRPRACC